MRDVVEKTREERSKWEMVKEQRKKTVRNTMMRGRVKRSKLTVVKKKKEKKRCDSGTMKRRVEWSK